MFHPFCDKRVHSLFITIAADTTSNAGCESKSLLFLEALGSPEWFSRCYSGVVDDTINLLLKVKSGTSDVN